MSAPIKVDSNSVLGVSWAKEQGSVMDDTRDVRVRTRDRGRWTAWDELHVDSGHGPDKGTAESVGARQGSDPLIVSGADEAQVRVATHTGKVPRDLRVDLIDPGATSGTSGPALSSASAAVLRPTIRSRADWGADESIRKGAPSYGQIDVGFVHHTAGSNSYNSEDVPGIIRGIYAYHVKTLGWNDIGYNFLVDKWGRMWEGRAGGTELPVVGAHTLGYNSHSFAMAVLGSYNSTPVPSAVEDAYTKLFAWKLGLSHVDPMSTTTLTDSDGSPTKVFRNISGHRDFGDANKGTECPGDALYSRIDTLRERASEAQDVMFYQPAVDRSGWTYGESGGVTISVPTFKELTWRIDVRSACRDGVLTSRTGSSSSTGIAAAWDGRIGDVAAPPGEYAVTLTATSGTGAVAVAEPWTTSVSVATVPGAPPGYCPQRIGGATRYEVAAAASREANASATTVVIASGLDSAMGDALVSAPLAGARGGVLLLADGGGMPAATRDEITRRGARTAYVVGGEGAVSPAAVEQLKVLGVTSVQRFGGRDRYATAAIVARAVAPKGAPDVMVVSGLQASMADGLVLSGPATNLRRPILLTSPTALPADTRLALSDLGTRRSVVGGGTGAVSEAVMGQLPSPTRLGGTSRYGTSVAVAKWASSSGVDGTDVLASSGEQTSLVDALSGGQLGRQLFYVRPSGVPYEVSSLLAARAELRRVTVMGGEDVVPPVVGGRLQEFVTD
jgi:putative cell wall-binding protein